MRNFNRYLQLISTAGCPDGIILKVDLLLCSLANTPGYCLENRIFTAQEIYIVRIALPGHPDSELVLALSQTLGLPVIKPTNAKDPVTGIPSDDMVIRLITEEIINNAGMHQSKNGFLLKRYPENVTQAQSLDMALARAAQPLGAALMIDSTNLAQNRENKALIRYYRSQNRLIMLEESSSVEDICRNLYVIHEKRRSHE